MATVVSPSTLVAPTAPHATEQSHGVDYARDRFDDTQRVGSRGLRIAAEFCPDDGASPFETAQWELRSAAIKDESGKALFEQKECEIPANWTQLAANVVVSKYFYGDPRNADERERSVRQLIHRVTRTIADWGLGDGYFDTPEDGERFYRDLTWLCLHQHGSFNSPVWFNVGLYHQYGVSGAKCNWHWDRTTEKVSQPNNPYEYPQGSACFIQHVEDNMEDIMRLACAEAMLFKFGSGTGTDLSTLRSQREKLSGGGTPSGPLSFMKVYDSIAGVVKSGGKTRRAAKMQSLKVWHPDVLEFIECKWSEEKKAHALIREGYESNFNGEAYSSVCFQNANLSVRVTDPFMEAVRDGRRWQTRWVSDKASGAPPEYDARELLGRMAECAWHCGDPGVQYDTTINKWHTCPTSGRINASNPCCFTGDTLVRTESHGDVSFERLMELSAVGDYPLVISWDSDLQTWCGNPIRNVWKSGETWTLAHVTVGGHTFRCTPEHRFMTENGEWIEAGRLQVGQRLKASNTLVLATTTGPATVTPHHWPCVEAVVIEELNSALSVYDIEVPELHNFSITDGEDVSVVVHNSEYMFLDDTACNLASVNLMRFVKSDGVFDHKRYQAACRVFLIAQEILVDHASYPTDDIAENSHRFRPLGLGYSNLGSVIMTAGLPYDSDAARSMCGSITSIMHGTANYTSAEMAAVVGPFDGYADNEVAMLGVMQMHRDAVEKIADQGPVELKNAARDLWEGVLDIGARHGFRNAQTTVLAPTGTISFMMDCDTTGIEPDIALVKYKQLAGGGMLKIVNNTVAGGLRKLGYDEPQIDVIIKFIDDNDTIEGAPGLADEHLPVFDCAFKPANGVRSIPWQAHVTMMAAAQPFLSGAISKTVNMPKEVTPKDISDAYFWGWELGLKAIAIYRDGSKQSQPLNTKKDEPGRASTDAAAATETAVKVIEKVVYKPRRERLEDTRQSITHKFSIAGHEGYLCVGLYGNGRPGEIFITMAKEGSTIGGIMDSFGTALSIALQYGVPLEVLVNKFSHTRFEPMGHTTNKDIRIAKSVVDYIARWLGLTFLAGHPEFGKLSNSDGKSFVGNGPVAAAVPVQTDLEEPLVDPATMGGVFAQAKSKSNGYSDQSSVLSGPADQFARFQSDAPGCDNCGSITVRNGNCYLCHNCGNSMGCS